MKHIRILITLAIFAFPCYAIEHAPTREFSGVTIYDSTASGVRVVTDANGIRHISTHDNDGTVTSSQGMIVELPAEVLPDDADMELIEKIETVQGNLGTMVLASELSEDELTLILNIYNPWTSGTSYITDNIFRYNNQLYKVNQAHTSQDDWLPDIVPALYTAVAPAGVIPDWVQPTGAQDAYNIGDQVSFNGNIYESLIDANVWSPTAYPAGWETIE